MGITGLLPLLKSIQKPCSLKKFAGQTIGVDAYGWLHRGTASCAIELAQDKPTTKFVDFAMSRVCMLVHFGITPYLVFDGDNLPSKSGTEKERRERRRDSRKHGLELLAMGKTAQAHAELQKSVDVTPEMARMLIEELKHHNIQYVVAPYEADSQLVYLERKGIINGILSEDSDLLVFGAKCLITKLDKHAECVEVNRNHFTACREISLAGWTDTDFRRMAILSGCDYLPGIGNMGLKTAYRMLRKHKTIELVIKAAQFDRKYKVANDYLEAFLQAERTFLYQWVFCPETKQLVNLTAPGNDIDVSKFHFIGEQVQSNVAYGVARGDLHPHSKQPIILRTQVKPTGKPLRPARQSSTSTQTPLGKHGKPIDSFFKVTRTPLAELDINLFTPSPSQQVLLEHQRNNPGWEAVQAPLPLQQQRPSQAHSAPQPSRRPTSFSMGTRQTARASPKRQRLCSDSVPDIARNDTEDVTTSRFFGASTVDPSPSIRSEKCRRRSSKQTAGLYSDDSLEQSMLELADLDEVASQPRKKLKVFNESSSLNLATDSQLTEMSKSATGTSQVSLIASDPDTPATSFGGSEDDLVFGIPSANQIKDLRSRFSYCASNYSPHPKNVSKTTPKRRRSTPMKGATNKLEFVKTSSRHVEQRILHTEKDGALFEDSAWTRMDAEVVVPASDDEELPARPLTPGGEFEVKGSEDLLVPESSDLESICSPRKPMLNLAKFAFGK